MGAVLGREYLVFGVSDAAVETQAMAFDRGAREHFVAGPAEAVSAQQLRQYGHAGFPAARDPAIRYRINPGVSVGIPAACGTLFEQVREGDSVLSDIAVGELPEVIRSDPVVGVHEDHEFAPCVVQSEISGCADTAVGDVEYADAFVLFSVTVADCSRTVGRSVVDEQQLEIGHALRENAPDTFIEVLRCIIDGGDN